jgi:hypothetical protein
MADVNAVKIAQRLGKILAVDDHDTTGLICQPFLRFQVELDSAQPLIPGFHLPRPGRDPLWISLRYERLSDYCMLCGLIGHKKIQCSQPPNRFNPDKYHIPLQTFSLVGLRQNPSPSREDSDSGISLVGTSQSHSDAHSSLAHGAELGLQLVPCQNVSHPAIHEASTFGTHDMQISSHTEIQPLALLSSHAGPFHDVSYVASPQPLHFLPLDICTQVGEYPLASSSSTHSSLSSLAATSHLGSSRLSAVDKGKSPMVFVPSASPTFPDPSPTYSLTNISYPCPITISPPLTHPAHFTDFLARWPQPFSPRPIINPSRYASSPHFFPLGPFYSFPQSTRSPPKSSIPPLSTTAPHLSFGSLPQKNTTPPLHPVAHTTNQPHFQIHPPYTSVTLTPVSLSLTSPPLTETPSPVPSSSRQAIRHSPRLFRFHPYTKPTSQTISPSLPLSPDTIQVRSPSTVLLPTKRKWTNDDIPLAVLKIKNKAQPLFPGLLSNMELAVISLASLQDGDSSVGTFLSINPLPEALRDSHPSSTILEPGQPHPVLSITDVSSASATGSTLTSQRPLRRFSRASRSLDVFSNIQAAQSFGSPAKAIPEKDTDDKGVDQEGLPPQQ